MTKLQIRSAVVRGVVLAMLGATVALVPVAGSAAEPAAAAAAMQNPRDLINGIAQQFLKELQTRREEL